MLKYSTGSPLPETRSTESETPPLNSRIAHDCVCRGGVPLPGTQQTCPSQCVTACIHCSERDTHSAQHTIASTNPYSVVGQPTMTAAQVDRVLQNAGSPAQGTGTAVYALSLKYGIDDAFAVAFFQHESTFGTRGEAQSSLSPGNLRCIPDAACVNTSGQPCQTEQSCYAAFPTWEAGFEAWYKLIRTLYVDTWHLTTIEQIIPRYAPNADHNDEANYIASVEASVAAFREVQG